MKTTMETKNSGTSQQFQSQVHIRTSPDASPENVDVFVGSDSTNSVTAPCVLKNSWKQSLTHTHTQPLCGAPA